MNKPDVVICLGKSFNKDGSLDWILTERVELAYSLANKHNVPLILTGGKSYKKLSEKVISSEASAMHTHLKKKHPDLSVGIIKEQKGQSTIHQLSIIKNKFLIPKKWHKVILVTDDIHLKRAKLITEWILGNNFKVVGYGSPINLVGSLRGFFEKSEKDKYDLTINSIINKIKKGDEKEILKVDKKVRSRFNKEINSKNEIVKTS